MSPPCQVRSQTENPCPHRAAVEIRGVAFCGPCAREQEAYFAIGELVALKGSRAFRSKPLAEALKRVRRESAGGTEGVAAEVAGNVQPMCNRSGRNGPNDTRSTSRDQIRLTYKDCIDRMNLLNRPTSQDPNTRNEQVSGSSPLVGSLGIW